MIEINIGALVVLLGIPTAVTGFCFWMLEHRIQKREKKGGRGGQTTERGSGPRACP